MSNRGFSDEMDGPIREAIEEGLAKNGGGMLTGYIGIFMYIDEDGTRCWSRIGSTPMIEAVGMVDVLTMSVRSEAADAFGFNREDD